MHSHVRPLDEIPAGRDRRWREKEAPSAALIGEDDADLDGSSVDGGEIILDTVTAYQN